jgi:DNA-binding GntR family transcriptional regulator
MIGTESMDHPSLVDRLIEHVFNKIASGEYPERAKITEQRLAADFGVSRTPVREAVRRLSEMGLLMVRPRCGIRISPVGDLKELAAIREELETFALRLAMPRMADNDVRRLEEAAAKCEQLLTTGTRNDVFRRDGRFHLLIAEMAGNRYLERILKGLEVMVQLSRIMHCRSDAEVREAVRFHHKLIEAIRKGDNARAEQLLREHIRSM